MTSRRKTYTRRALIGAGSLLGCGALFAGAAGGAHFYTTRPESNVGELEFDTPLHIPPLLEGELDADGLRQFDLTLQTGQTRIVPAGQAETWGVNGPFLAPTLHAGAATVSPSASTTSCRRRPPSTGTGCTCRQRWMAVLTR
jgi:FtsP/CotA-like multicopper oxidase with cupredoxin domain